MTMLAMQKIITVQFISTPVPFILNGPMSRQTEKNDAHVSPYLGRLLQACTLHVFLDPTTSKYT